MEKKSIFTGGMVYSTEHTFLMLFGAQIEWINEVGFTNSHVFLKPRDNKSEIGFCFQNILIDASNLRNDIKFWWDECKIKAFHEVGVRSLFVHFDRLTDKLMVFYMCK